MQVQDQAFGAAGADNLKDVTYQGDRRPGVNHTVHGDRRRHIVPGEFDQERWNWTRQLRRPFSGGWLDRGRAKTSHIDICHGWLDNRLLRVTRWQLPVQGA